MVFKNRTLAVLFDELMVTLHLGEQHSQNPLHFTHTLRLSTVNSTLTVRDSRPRFILTGGSYCKARADSTPGDMRGSALVEFTCDKSVLGPGQPRLVAQLPPGDDEEACAWVIEWRTHVRFRF